MDERFKRTRKEYWELYDRAMQDPYSIPADVQDEVTEFLSYSHASEECGDMIYFDSRNMDEFFDYEEDYEKTIAWLKEQ